MRQVSMVLTRKAEVLVVSAWEYIERDFRIRNQNLSTGRRWHSPYRR